MLFDRIHSGYPGADEVFDYIRIGDNVVWQVSDLDAYRLFAQPFVNQAIADGRNVIYIHFTHHEQLLSARPGLKIYEFDPDMGFEPFTVAIYDRITAEGRGGLLRLRLPERAAVRLVHRPDDGQLLPRHMSLSLRARDSGLLPASARTPLV